MTSSPRIQALTMLCQMDPTQLLAVRNRCVEMTRLPSLAVSLTLAAAADDQSLVPFVSGLLLGTDQQVRTWFSHYVRNGAKKKSETLLRLRATLLRQLADLAAKMQGRQQQQHAPSTGIVVQSTALLRLYTALRGIAGLKYAT